MNYGVLLTVAAWLISPVVLQANDFFVAPSPKATGKGTLEKPWDLQTALSHAGSVKPGDTLWLRGGVHRLCNRPTRFVSTLTGEQGLPITVRQYPGERAIVDGNISQTTGGWVQFWGFEILNSTTNRYTVETGPFPQMWWANYDGETVEFCVSGLDIQAPNIKAINMIVHDSIGGGFGINKAARDTEIYGCLSFYNGWQGSDRGHGHGIYGQNEQPYVKTIRDSLIFYNLALGMQFTGSGDTPVADNLNLEGTAFFMNGNLAQSHQCNLLVGSYKGVGQSPVICGNFIYDTQGTMSDCNLGYEGGLNNAVVCSNYFGTSVFFGPNSNLTLSGNFFASTRYHLDESTYAENTYDQPCTNAVFFRPSKYEKGRGNIIIYNWEALDAVTVDVSSCGLAPGDAYDLHNAADFFGDVEHGVYSGAPISIPMTGHTVARPIGANFQVPEATFPIFGAFVITKNLDGTEQQSSSISTLQTTNAPLQQPALVPTHAPSSPAQLQPEQPSVPKEPKKRSYRHHIWWPEVRNRLTASESGQE